MYLKLLSFLTPEMRISLGIIAGVLMIAAQLIMIRDIKKKPDLTLSILSWLGWSILMGTSLVSQILDKGEWQWSLTVLLLSTVGCSVITCMLWKLKKYSYEKIDLFYFVLGLACFVLYLKTSDAWFTTSYAIIADFIIGLPTLKKAFKDPLSHKSGTWFLGFISWGISLINCLGQSWLYALFPVYLFSFNVAMLLLTSGKSFKK